MEVERVQTGIRMEKRLLKVLKGLAEYKDLTLGDLLEGIVLHAFEDKPPFAPETLAKIRQLKALYELELDAGHSHALREAPRKPGGSKPGGSKQAASKPGGSKDVRRGR